MSTGFQGKWLGRFGLHGRSWRSQAREHLRNLPFSDYQLGQTLIFSLFDEVPERLEQDPCAETAELAEAFAWCCFSMWQCGSAMPAFPENYAVYLKEQFFKEKRKRQKESLLLARMIVWSADEQGRCGFNRLRLQNPALVRNSEKLMLSGEYEFYLKAQEKYAEYLQCLANSSEFQRDWKGLKRTFPRQTSGPGIIHRSLLPERNWERGPGVMFQNTTQRFQAAFDLFCWKYFLWGMRGDQPFLMKPSVVFTPLGTQIFIPGYLSLDAKRDIDFAKVNDLHRARGVPRQGAGFVAIRKEKEQRHARAKQLNREARQLGLKGAERFTFIAKGLGWSANADHSHLRRLLRNKLTNNGLRKVK